MVIRWSIKLMILCIILLMINVSTIDGKIFLSSVKKTPLLTSYGNYKPVKIKVINEIPQQVYSNVTTHLIERVGTEFYSKLEFAGGEKIDIKEMNRIDPKTKEFKWRVPSYDLYYLIRWPKQSVKAYYAQIKLDEEGNIIQEIDLPQISKYPEKAYIISKSKAEKIASQVKQKGESIYTKIDYNEKADSIVWKIGKMDNGTEWVISVDAHNGQVIDNLGMTGFY